MSDYDNMKSMNVSRHQVLLLSFPCGYYHSIQNTRDCIKYIAWFLLPSCARGCALKWNFLPSEGGPFLKGSYMKVYMVRYKVSHTYATYLLPYTLHMQDACTICTFQGTQDVHKCQHSQKICQRMITHLIICTCTWCAILCTPCAYTMFCDSPYDAKWWHLKWTFIFTCALHHALHASECIR